MDEIDKLYQEAIQKRNISESEIKKIEGEISCYIKLAWCCIALGVGISIFGIFMTFHGNKPLELNELGDFLSGTVVALWSLAGLILIYVAFLGQKQQLLNQQIELSYNQIEIRATRLEIEGQKKQLIAQNETLTKQRFENTFFQLVQLFNSNINSMDIGSVTGKDCFRTLYKKLGHISHQSFENAKLNYEVFFDQYQSDLGHYFRVLYHIIRLIDTSAEIKDKKKYSRFIRAQLSNDELALLQYNGISKYGEVNMKPLIERYSLLDNLPETHINNEVKIKYKKSAYK